MRRALVISTLALSLAAATGALADSAPAPGSDRAFNPQPEPPKVRPTEESAAGNPAPGSDRAFNPQPEPPKVIEPKQKAPTGRTPGSDRMFNPQPEPPAAPVQKLPAK